MEAARWAAPRKQKAGHGCATCPPTVSYDSMPLHMHGSCRHVVLLRGTMRSTMSHTISAPLFYRFI